MKNNHILIVDDELVQREILTGYLNKKGYKLFSASSGEEGISIVKNNQIDIVLSDYKMPDKTGFEMLKEIKLINPEINFIMITAYGTIQNAVQAMRAGAYDYLSKPVDLDELDLMLERIIEHQKLKSENYYLKTQLQEKHKLSSFVTHSPKMEEVLSVAARVADSKATVLITGENGTGKEVLAKAIHYISPRKNNPFVAVNIPALSESLIESELFGHEKGAFTGADRTRIGRFESSDKGTIFLDEIGDIPLSTQVKLLRVLQEHQIERVGGTEHIDIDVRVIAATNQNLELKISDGTFRKDLFYRLNIVAIKIPPLRDRKEDILPLAEYFMEKYRVENNKERIELSKEAADILLKYNYPGNVRELENIIERAVVLSRDSFISRADLSRSVRGYQSENTLPMPINTNLNDQVEALEKKMIFDALKEAGGNQTKAGKLLGISERNLRYKLNKYNIK